MKIKSNFYLRQLVLSIIAINILFLGFVYLIGEIQLRKEGTKIDNFIEKSFQGNSKPENKMTEICEQLHECWFQVYYYGTNGKLKYSSNKLTTRAKETFELLQEPENFKLKTNDIYRIRKIRGETLLFEFPLPPRPEVKDIFSKQSKYLESAPNKEKLQHRIFISFFTILNLSLIVGFLINKLTLFRFLKKKTQKTEHIYQSLLFGGELKLLRPTGLKELDEMILVINNMLSKLKSDFKALTEKDQEMKDLVQEISHDFKTPVSSINTLSQILIKKTNPDESKEIVEGLKIINKETIFLTKLVEDLLFISNIASKKTNLEPVLLNHIIEEELPRFANFNKKIIFDKDEDLEIEIDYLHAQRMIRNLLENAIQNCDSKVEIKTIKNENKLVISNDGSSIEDKESYGRRQLSRKFDLSVGISISMGLGSVIIRKIIEKYNLKLKIEDAKPTGTNITILK